MSFISVQSASFPTALGAARTRDVSPRLVGALILTTAAVIHSLRLGSFDISSDEAHSYLMATSHQPLFAQLQNDTNPPLYFLLLKYWMVLFGSSLVAMRSLSMVFALALAAASGLLARTCHASTKTILLTMVLTAFNPLQFFYAQDARNYALSCLLVVLGLLTFLHAIHSAKKFPWLLHALVIAVSAYAHFLLIPITLGYWIAAPLLRFTRVQYLRLAIAHALAAACAIPILFLILHQMHNSDGTAWIAPYWNSISHLTAIPHSLELLPFGSQIPSYLPVTNPSPLLRLLGLAVLLPAAAAFFYPKKSQKVLPDLGHELGNTRWLLLVFTLWPLVFLLLYSLFFKPIYLHARYDLLAQPPYLVLLAAGLIRVQGFFASRHLIGKFFVPAGLAILFIAGISAHLNFAEDAPSHRHRDRAAYLATVLHPNDVVICTGLEAAPTRYYLDQLHIAAAIVTFPNETFSHVGWFMTDESIQDVSKNWPLEAKTTLAGATWFTHKTTFILMDRACWEPTPEGFIALPRQQLTETLIETASSMGFRRAAGSSRSQEIEDNLRLTSLTQSK